MSSSPPLLTGGDPSNAGTEVPHKERTQRCSPSHFVPGLGGTPRGAGHHGHLDWTLALSTGHQAVELPSEGFTRGLHGLQLGLDALETLAYCGLEGTQQALGNKPNVEPQRLAA